MLHCRIPFAGSNTNQPRAVPTRFARSRMYSVAAKATSPKEFLESCTGLGKTRFIVIGNGAILESVSEFSRIKYTDIPNKGTLATISSEDKSFECHLYLSKLKQAKLAKSKAKHGDYDMYATRFTDESGQVLLSCLVHGSNGNYDAAAVQAWSQLVERYGDSVMFS